MTHSELRRAAKDKDGNMPDKKVVKAESELRNIFHELKRREQEQVKKKKTAREIAEDERRFRDEQLRLAREEELRGLMNRTEEAASALKREDELLAYLWKRDEAEAKKKEKTKNDLNEFLRKRAEADFELGQVYPKDRAAVESKKRAHAAAKRAEQLKRAAYQKAREALKDEGHARFLQKVASEVDDGQQGKMECDCR